LVNYRVTYKGVRRKGRKGKEKEAKEGKAKGDILDRNH
jgi:hypothetical protein